MRDVPYAPLTGSPSGLEDLSAAAARAAAALTETRTVLDRLDRALEGQRSDAVTAARTMLDEVRAEASLCADVLDAAARALARRASGLACEQRDAQQAITSRALALDRRRRADDDEATAWRTAADLLDPQHADAVRLVWAARERATQADADVASCERQWHGACDTKELASQQAAPGLVGLSHVRTVRLAASAGTGAAAYGAAWHRGLQLGDLVTSIGTGAAPGDGTEARAELEAALVAAGDDPALWAAFWTSTSPAEVYAAFGAQPLDGALAAALQTGSASWAASATAAEQESFGRAVVTDVGDDTMGLGVRGGLAAALLPPSMPAAVHTGAATAWSDRRLDRGPQDIDLLATAPLSRAIADGLAAHPAAALAYFAPDEAGPAGGQAELEQRVHAWFGQTPRDGWPDGGTAVAGLYAAAIGAGTQDASRTEQGQAALLASTATTVLVSGRGLLAGPVGVSDAASKHVADAYQPYLATADDQSREQSKDDPPAAPGVDDGFVLADATGVRAEVVQAELNTFAFREVIAATSQTEDSSGHWLDATITYLDDMAGHAAAPDCSPADREALGEAGIRDAGFVLGATQSETISVAREERAQAERVTALFSTTLSVATLPARVGTSAAATGVGVLLPTLVPDGVEEARSSVLADEAALRELAADRFHDTLPDLLRERGAPADEIVDAEVRFDPDSPGMKNGFGEGFSTTSGVHREMGEYS